jgi:hypothetical protein
MANCPKLSARVLSASADSSFEKVAETKYLFSTGPIVLVVSLSTVISSILPESPQLEKRVVTINNRNNNLHLHIYDSKIYIMKMEMGHVKVPVPRVGSRSWSSK